MKKTIDFYTFSDSFRGERQDSFSYDGLKALFDYLEELEEGTGEEVELDPIGLCCEYSEYGTAKEALKDIGGLEDINIDWEDKDEAKDEEAIEEAALEYLENETILIRFDGGIIIGQF